MTLQKNHKQNCNIIIDHTSDVDVVAGASVSVASVSGCQYLSCQCLWLPESQLPVSLAARMSVTLLLPEPQLPVSRLPGTSVASASALSCHYLCISCQCFGLPVPKLPKLSVLLPQLPVYAGALVGVQVLMPWLPRISPSQLLRTLVRRYP